MRSFLTALLAILSVTLAQPALAQEPTPAPPPSTHPALDVLLWGIDFFPFPDWQVNVEASALEARSVWSTGKDYLAIVTYTRQFGDTVYSGEEVSQLISPDWFSILLADYDSWQEVSRCHNNTHLTVNLKAVEEGISYTARYWVWSEEGTLVSALGVYQEDNAVQLEALGEVLIKTLPRCE